MNDTDLPYSIYSASLSVVSVVDLVLQAYIIFICLRVSTGSMKEYRYFILLSTVLDLCLSSCLGFFMHLHITVGTSCLVHKGLITFGREGASIVFSLAFFIGAAIIAAQDYCILYRMTLVSNNRKIKDVFLRHSTTIMLLLLIFVVAMGVAYGISQTLYSSEDTEIIVRDLVDRGHLHESDSISVSCINMLSKTTVIVGAMIGILFVSTQAFFLGCGVWIIKKIRRQAVFSAKTKNMHIQLTKLLIVQMVTPVIFVLVPVVFTQSITVVFSLFNTPYFILYLAMFSISLFPLTNAILTLGFVAPYRKYTVKLIRRLLMRNTQVSTNTKATNTSEWGASDVIRRNEMSVFFIRTRSASPSLMRRRNDFQF
ncbi:serpentine type 7TM GPCR chemoreceptor srh domain-containing protein [Ditylenchus destructor]|uniref:Serpentine type 7TM GPCR chemoreceptor srh domain-containing protein n=1 Tax=Ditylenchus destructor TaxID=166010 RepID=A0AAD4MKC3_9BILA|nr:serpentine type 7TM GPCR chemoreceptor srh domain-containing protein [Ditylenchus destructor]